MAQHNPAHEAGAHHQSGATEELTLPHGSKWPIIAACGIALIYLGLGFLHAGGLGIGLAGLGALIILVAISGIINEDADWWSRRVSTGLRNGWWGVLFFLGTEVMLFSALFATYFNHRALGGPAWGTEVELPVLKTGINTVILLLSGVTMHWAHSGIRKGNLRQLKIGLAATILLGAVFLGGQVLEYLELAGEGLIVQSGTFGGVFYALTGTHGAHVLGGLVTLCLVGWRAMKGQFDQQRHVAVEVTAIYWHFVDVVWVVLYAVVYLRIL
jgi:cytochrome c oxidase subunit III